MEAIADVIQDIKPGDKWTAPPSAKVRRPDRATLDDLDTSHPAVAAAVKAARAWAQRKRDGYADASLVLAGPYGTGKTHIAKAILWSIVQMPEGASHLAVPVGRFFLANDLLLKLSPTTGEFGISSTPRVSSLLGEAPLVVVDDVGGQQILPFVAREDQEHERHARYFRFVDYCYTVQTSVIVTTNLSLSGGHESEVARHIGGRAWDRLCEMAPAGFMIGLAGVPSWRVKAGGR
jgi:DNA replication protein DnaC